MGRAYSNDLRERVAVSVLGGRSCRATAELFGVSVASAVKWSQRRRATGSAASRPLGRKQPRSLAAEREWLLERLATKPDVTLRALVAELGERGVVTSYGSVWRIVREAGVTFKKKTLIAREQDRPTIARRRAQWRKYQGRIDPHRLVFIGDCHDFRVRSGIMGTRSPPYVTTQRADDTNRAARPVADRRRGQRCL